MALYNFKKRFVPMILTGDKRHTIRAKRKRRTVPGEIAHLYTGLRQKGATLLMRSRCSKVEDIEIRGGCLSLKPVRIRPFKIFVDGIELSTDEAEQLAKSDGFSSLAEMAEFWKGRTPFFGDIIHWNFPPEVWGNEGRNVERESSQAHLSETVSVPGMSQHGRGTREILQRPLSSRRLEGASSKS